VHVDILNDLKRHLFFGNLSFNFEVVALDVDDCCAFVSSSIVGICGLFFIYVCRNPSLGLTTKARGCKVAGQKRNLKVMPHAPENARKCEGIDLHTPKGTPTLGVGVPVDS